MFLTDLPYATLANDPGQTEEQHRTPDVQKTPDHQNAISFLQKVSPHQHSFNPTKLDHFALLLALQIIFPLVRFLQICDVLIILWLASWKALICLNVKLVTILSKIVRALFHTTELRGNK